MPVHFVGKQDLSPWPHRPILEFLHSLVFSPSFICLHLVRPLNILWVCPVKGYKKFHSSASVTVLVGSSDIVCVLYSHKESHTLPGTPLTLVLGCLVLIYNNYLLSFGCCLVWCDNLLSAITFFWLLQRSELSHYFVTLAMKFDNTEFTLKDWDLRSLLTFLLLTNIPSSR